MRPIDKIRNLCAVLQPEHLTTVVDVGANPFAGSPPYGTLRRSDCCRVIGFEPQKEALASLRQNARHNDCFLPYAVGDGSQKQLFITKNSGLVSVLRPQPEIAKLLGKWWNRATEIASCIPIQTHCLDDIAEVDRIDFLKIDIQGGELDVFRNARLKLGGCCVIQTEICLHPYYDGQPSFGDIQTELSSQGFLTHKFVDVSAHPISNDLKLGKTAKAHKNQVTVADLIFVRDPSKLTDTDSETLKQMAILSFAVFRSFDLTLRCLSDLQKLGVLEAGETREVIQVLGI